MKFTLKPEIGTDYSTVILQGHLSAKVLESLYDVFKKLGAICPNNHWDEWKFPSFITAEVIQETIRNTCFVCGGLMRDDEHPYSFEKLRKCTSCGHSHT